MGMMFCRGCGKELHETAPICPHCGAPQNVGPTTNVEPSLKNQTVAGLLCAFLGGFGAHKFYLGRITAGVLFVLFCWTGIPGLIAFFNLFGIAFASQEKWAKEYNNGVLSPPVHLIVKIIVLILPATMLIGIMAAIAIPAYVDYTQKAKTAEVVMGLSAAKTSVAEFALSKPGAVMDAPTLQAVKDSVKNTPAITGIDAFTYKTYADIVADVTINQLTGQIIYVSHDSGSSWACQFIDLPKKLMPANCEASEGLNRPAIEVPHLGLWRMDFALATAQACINSAAPGEEQIATIACKCTIEKLANTLTQDQMVDDPSAEVEQIISRAKTECASPVAPP